MSIIGQWQKRLESILKYVMNPREFDEISDNLVIDNPLALTSLGRSSQNKLTISDVLKPYLEKRMIQLVLIATPEEWDRMKEKDRRFCDLFQVIRTNEVDVETAYKIAFKQRSVLEMNSGTTISTLAVNRLFELHRTFFHTKALPGGVIQLMRQMLTRYRNSPVDIEQVDEAFRNISGLRGKIVDNTALLTPLSLQKEIEAELVGQPQAVKALSDAIHIIKARLNNPAKPYASFLFTGPTGVGKTQAAKVLAKYLLDSEENLIRFDMNEYIDAGSLERLIGTPQHPEGQITGQVRYHTFGVLLFDEIEKAHPGVHDLLLQVLDEGRLTDSMGRTVDFTNFVIILTSNIGARETTMKLGFNSEHSSLDNIFRKAIENFFRPEFINRIDKIVIFQPLREEHIVNIARLQIKELLSRDGFVRRNTIFNIDGKALEWVAKRGFDPLMGGRALKRQIEQDLTLLSAQQLLTLDVNQPVVFTVTLSENRLVPKIVALELSAPTEFYSLVGLPFTEKQYRKNLHGLLSDTEYLKNLVNDIQDELSAFDQNEFWYLFDLKEKIESLKQSLQTAILRIGDKSFLEATQVLKIKKTGFRSDYKQGFILGSEIVKWREAFLYNDVIFNHETSEVQNYQLQFFMLERQCRSLQNAASVDIRITFHSALMGTGEEQIAYLMEKYEALLRELDYYYAADNEDKSFAVSGLGAYDWFRSEDGIHVFYPLSNAPIPVIVRVTEKAPEPITETNKIIRVYDQDRLVTDVRSNLIANYNMTPQEFNVLIYASQPVEEDN